MTDAQTEICAARAMGQDAAMDMLARTSHDAACQYLNANSNADTLQAYEFWSGFLNVLAARI